MYLDFEELRKCPDNCPDMKQNVRVRLVVIKAVLLHLQSEHAIIDHAAEKEKISQLF